MLESATKSLICFLEGTIATLHSKVEEAASEVTVSEIAGQGLKSPESGSLCVPGPTTTSFCCQGLNSRVNKRKAKPRTGKDPTASQKPELALYI